MIGASNKQEVIVSFKDDDGNERIITNKEAILTEMNVASDNPRFLGANINTNRLITLNLEFKLAQFDMYGNSNQIIESFQSGFKPSRKIDNLKVSDCSINELLVAVKRKINKR